ncbi:peptidylprolyl isomerase [Cytophagaceae bacterium ABcell3]|nr:peptidylprolyl isomerase [Cytophagaceae bacterium ABcell3]
MKITRDKVVAIDYELKVKSEGGGLELVEKTEGQEPMVFLFGQSGLPEKFEENLDGKQEGDAFEFSLTSNEAYGDIDENAIVKFPSNVFAQDGVVDTETFKPGAIIPMSDPDGNVLRGRVLEVTPTEVEMDFNHPLAGYDLHFEGNVKEVREATEEELSHGHAHGPGGVQH